MTGQPAPGSETSARARRLTPLAAALLAALAAGAVLLWPWGPPATPETPSIAVLRFADPAGGAEPDYFAEGMADALIADLSRVAGVVVIARTSAFAFGAAPDDLGQVGAALGVRYVLAGSVQRTDAQLHLDARLIDAASGDAVWAARYERAPAEVFVLQDELAGAVLAALSVEPTEAEAGRIRRRPTADLAAYDDYLRAEQKAHAVRAETLAGVLALYERALALDPGFADAHAGYARAVVDVLGFDHESSVTLGPVLREEAYETATRALALDPDNARAHGVLGVLQMLDGAHGAAIASVQQAVALEPGGAGAHLDRAIVLTYAGRHAEALAAMEIVLRLDPRSQPQVYDQYGLVLFMNRRYADAVAAVETGDAGAHSDFGLEVLAMARARLGQTAEAAAALDALLARNPLHCLAFMRLLYAHHRLPEDLAFRLEALGEAGLPEWPAGFSVRPDDRLGGDAVRALVLGRTWAGSRRYDSQPVAMRVSADGAMTLRIADDLVAGTAAVEGDELCIGSPAAMLGRRFCGAVYRNPAGSAEAGNEYYYPTVFGVLYFTVAP